MAEETGPSSPRRRQAEVDLLAALADLRALVPVTPTPNGVGHTCAAQLACLAEEDMVRLCSA